MRHVGQVSPCRSVPQMKHCRNGPRAGALVGAISASFWGKGGGRGAVSVCGSATGGDEAGASAGDTLGAGAGSGTGAVVVPEGASVVGEAELVSEGGEAAGVAGGGEVDGSAADFDRVDSEGDSFSFRFLRKNAILLRNSSGTLLLRSSGAGFTRDMLLRPLPFAGA